jgi:hypothetical protein
MNLDRAVASVLGTDVPASVVQIGLVVQIGEEGMVAEEPERNTRSRTP